MPEPISKPFARRRMLLAIFAVLAMLVMPRPALADGAYRDRILIADGIAGGIVGVGLLVALGSCAADSSKDDCLDGVALTISLVSLGLGTYVIVPPILHLQEGEGLRASASLSMRITLPILTGYLGSRTDRRDAALIAGLLGMGAAALLDGLVLTPGEESESLSMPIISLGGRF